MSQQLTITSIGWVPIKMVPKVKRPTKLPFCMLDITTFKNILPVSLRVNTVDLILRHRLGILSCAVLRSRDVLGLNFSDETRNPNLDAVFQLCFTMLFPSSLLLFSSQFIQF